MQDEARKKFRVLGAIKDVHFGSHVDITREPWPVFDTNGSDILLEDYCVISSGVYIHTHTHQFDKINWRDLPKVKFDKPTIIGAYSFLGVNVQIMPTCKYVGYFSVIGAGSIVTKDVPDKEIWAGNPAVKIGEVS